MASGTGAQYVPTAGEGKVPAWTGIYYGYIAVNADPLSQGRVKLRVPQVFGNTTSGWASPMVPVTYIPKVGTAVTVMFVGGDPARPVWGGNFAVAGTPPVVIGSGAPTGTGSATGEIYYDSSDGMKTYEWNGAAWVQYQVGTGGIATGVGLTEPTITGGTITGSQFIADGTSGEILAYTGAPATGNMNASLSPVSGTDGHSNPYYDGFTVYHGSARIQVHVNTTVGAPAVEMPTGASSEQGGAALYTWSPNLGDAGEYIEAFWQGPSSSHDGLSAAVALVSSAKDGSGLAASGTLFADGEVASWNATGFSVYQPLYGNGGTLTVHDVIQANSDVHVAGTLYGTGGVLTVGDRLSAGSWASMSLVNGWTVSGTGFAQYKLMPDHTVMVRAAGLLPGATGDGTTIWGGIASTFTGTMSFPVVANYTTAPTAVTSTPQVVIAGGYSLEVYNLRGTVANIAFTFSYPLD